MYRYANGSFYPYFMKDVYVDAGSWPESGVDIDEEQYTYFKKTPAGKKLSTDASGNPIFIDDDTDYGWVSMAVVRRDDLMATATYAIQPLQDAVDLDEATEAEVSLLRKLKQYRVALNRLDLSTAPDITWPLLPTEKIGS